LVARRYSSFLLGQVLRIAQPDQAYFWAPHQGVEFKRSDAPGLTASMRVALSDLKLDKLYVVYPGHQRCALAPNVEVVPLTALLH
jgi:hypothetical protein